MKSLGKAGNKQKASELDGHGGRGANDEEELGAEGEAKSSATSDAASQNTRNEQCWLAELLNFSCCGSAEAAVSGGCTGSCNDPLLNSTGLGAQLEAVFSDRNCIFGQGLFFQAGMVSFRIM